MLVKIAYIVFAYLCGSIPFAYIVAKAAANVDIRTVGSGNPGATNVFRAVGKKAGTATFIADGLKGFIPVYFAFLIDQSFAYSAVIAVAALLGHMFPVFLKLKGGKGVATACGAFLALMPLPTIIAFAVFALVFVFSGYVALGSICAAVVLPAASYFSGYAAEAILFAFAVALLIIYKHRSNIKRLKKGTENRFKIFRKGK